MADGEALVVEAEAPAPAVLEIFLAFSRVGLTSFGGGLSGWMMREFVQRRRWVDEGEFLSGLALAQALPGVNVVNLSIWIGFRLRGGPGALAGALGMIVPPMLLAVALVALSGTLLQSPLAYKVLAGVAAAALGLSLQMGLRAARRAARGVVPVAVMAITFLAIFQAGLPLLWVVAAMAPVSIAWSAWRLRRGA
ncbi:chromate transporter [Roseomonas sp. M0104]|uniref:Chromate transporter n=1 Tax=Teichococcus coralli TaxID=2545983 RepID=A0A845B5R9_9PROT|nr:chromate transporter [Pseudoroseomonas coralli]MXP62973.1 chromate transporter [Pseudoroseomonas coralli]